MKKILIPTDFTLNSFQTIDYVLKLFKHETCEFYFLNTYSYDANGLDAIQLLQADEDWFDKPKQNAQKQLGKLVERYTLNCKALNHQFFAVSDCSELLLSIQKNIKDLNIDLIILTSKKEKNLGKKTQSIVEKIRCCPVLIVPPHAATSNKINITIASDFKQQVNTHQIDKFLNILENTNLEITVLILEKQKALSDTASNNLEAMLDYLKQISGHTASLHYIGASYNLKAYAQSHLDGIMCVIDKKPHLLRKIGVFKSDIFSTLKQLHTNTVLTIHQ